MGVSELLGLWPSCCAAPQADVRSLPKHLSACICIPCLAPSRCWWTLRVWQIYILVNPNRCMWNKAWQVNSLLKTLCLEGQLSRKWTTDLSSEHQITASSVYPTLKPITLITVLPGYVCVRAHVHVCHWSSVHAISRIISPYACHNKNNLCASSRWCRVCPSPCRPGRICPDVTCLCVCLKESSCFIRLSEGVLVPYSWASKDSVQTLAYKLSSIFILSSTIWNH